MLFGYENGSYQLQWPYKKRVGTETHPYKEERRLEVELQCKLEDAWIKSLRDLSEGCCIDVLR